MKRARFPYLVFAIFIVLFGLRLIHISADPPANLSFSGGLFFDEGAYVHNARNKILFGEWKLDEWNDFYYSPILTYIKWAVFSTLGVGLAQLRLVSIIFSCLTLGVFYLALRVTLRRSTVILSMFLLGFNYIYLMYSRLGLYEIPLLFFTVLTLYFWQLGIRKDHLRHGRWYMFFAGISCFTVYIFKASVIYFLPVPVVSLFFLWLFSDKQLERKRLLNLIGFLLAGMIITGLLWLVIFYYPNYHDIHRIGNYILTTLSLPHSFWGFLDNVFSTPFLLIFLKTPLILILAIGYFIYLLYLTFHNRSKLEPVDIFIGLWFIAHVLFYIGYSYRPTRYYLPIIPPMSLLAARGIMHIREMKSPYNVTSWFWGGFWLVAGILWIDTLFYVYNVHFKPFTLHFQITVPKSKFYSMLILGVVFTLMITVIMVWWVRKYRGNRIQIPHKMRLGIPVTLLLISVSVNGIQYYRWASHPQYEIRNISRELGTLLENAFIAGLSMPMLCIENTHKALYVWENFTNYQNTLEKYAITHLFLGEFNGEVEYYHRKFPELMKQATLLKTYWIKGSRFHLYAVAEPSI